MAQSSSAGSSSHGGRGYDGRGSPVPYRTLPLAYEPAVFCDCKPKLKAKRWIAWSDGQSGRRYPRCPRARTKHDCQFYRWVDEECSPWYKEVLRDLRDAVWSMKDDLAAKEGDVEALSRKVVAVEMELEQKKEAQEKQVQLDVKQEELNGKDQQVDAKDEALVAVQGQLKNKNQCIDALVVICSMLIVLLVVVLMHAK